MGLSVTSDIIFLDFIPLLASSGLKLILQKLLPLPHLPRSPRALLRLPLSLPLLQRVRPSQPKLRSRRRPRRLQLPPLRPKLLPPSQRLRLLQVWLPRAVLWVTIPLQPLLTTYLQPFPPKLPKRSSHVGLLPVVCMFDITTRVEGACLLAIHRSRLVNTRLIVIRNPGKATTPNSLGVARLNI